MLQEQQEILMKLVTMKMPFGKYEGKLLADLPVSYLEWFQRKGFPQGKLGEYLSLLHTIKSNGLDDILYKLKRLK
ncbi:MAG: DUF3820 family protein [Salibacteraceae bacterium]|jgi:uncharacterized protein|nr:DUF3820 family protein [Salibacteraceae bacterium]MDP4686666.1 DUF3820 family protein [Salibacteraceae bacterium]MDP4762397.1 DUF3820 family protein [Salibacteraceae bacterium]MDP4933359.1 DUF3820 family protein [Salibacteraceae bacterium]